MKKGLSFFLCVMIAAFLIISPAFLITGLNRNIYAMRREDAADDYRGTLKFWHVVSFKTASKSGYEYLRARSGRFERTAPYVFIELRGMSLEEANRRMEEGERPDIISFPAGQIDETGMLRIPAHQNHIKSLLGFSDCAKPYMADSYVIVLNETLLRELGIPQGYGGELSAERFYDAYAKLSQAQIIPIAATQTAGLNTEEALGHLALQSDESYPEEVRAIENPLVREDGEAFLSEEAGMYLCPYSEYMLQKKSGYGFSAEAYAFTDYTDIVQMIGAYESEDAAKNEMMRRFIEGFFTEKMQKELESLSMLPCTFVEGIYDTDQSRLESYLRMTEKAANT